MGWIRENAELTRHFRNAMRRNKLLFVYTGYAALWLIVLLAQVSTYTSAAEAIGQSTLDAGLLALRHCFLEMGVVNAGLMTLAGCVAASASMGRERAVGTLDFLRLTSTSRYQLAVGKVIGPNLVIFACVLASLPQWIVCMAMGGGTPAELVVFLAVGVSFALMSSALAAAVTGMIVRKKPAQHGDASAGVAVLVLLLMVGLPISLGRAWPREFSAMAALFPFRPMLGVCRGRIEAHPVLWWRMELPAWVFNTVWNLVVATLATTVLARRLRGDTTPAIGRRHLYAMAGVVLLLLAGMEVNAWPSALLPDWATRSGLYGGPSRLDDGHIHDPQQALDRATALLALLVAAAFVLAPNASCTLYEFRAERRRARRPAGLKDLLLNDRTGPAAAGGLVVCLLCAASFLPLAAGMVPGAHMPARDAAIAWAPVAVSAMLCGVFLFLLAETCVLARGDRQPVVIYAVAVVLWFVAPPIAGLIVSEIPGKESAGELVRFTGFGAVLIQAVAGGPRRPTVAAVPANLCLSLLAVAYVLLLNRRVRARIMAQAADEEQAGRPAAPQASAAESGPTASAPPGHAQ